MAAAALAEALLFLGGAKMVPLVLGSIDGRRNEEPSTLELGLLGVHFCGLTTILALHSHIQSLIKIYFAIFQVEMIYVRMIEEVKLRNQIFVRKDPEGNNSIQSLFKTPVTPTHHVLGIKILPQS